MNGFRSRIKLVDAGLDWMGPVPHDWKVRRLGYFFAERRRKVSDRDFAPLSVTMVGVVPQLEHVAKTDDGDNRKLACAGDFVINSRSDRKGSGGIAPRDGSVSLINTVLEPTGELDIDFAAYLLTSYPFQEEFYRVGNGIVADMWTTKYAEMRNIRVACPSLDEQHRISSFLDRETARIDTLIKRKTRFIALLREKRQALITRAVTKGLDPDAPMKDSGVEWLGQVPAHWAVCKLNFRYSAELGKMLDGKRNMGLNSVPYLRNQDVQWHGINADDLPVMDIASSEMDRYTAVSGDLLVCEGGEVGRAAIWRNGPIGYQKALHRLRPRRHDDSEFMCLLLRAAKGAGAFDEGDTKSTISHLPAEKFRDFKFVFPPSEEQTRIVCVVQKKTTRIDTMITKTERSITLLREKRTALITAAVTGKIDLAAAA